MDEEMVERLDEYLDENFDEHSDKYTDEDQLVSAWSQQLVRHSQYESLRWFKSGSDAEIFGQHWMFRAYLLNASSLLDEDVMYYNINEYAFPRHESVPSRYDGDVIRIHSQGCHDGYAKLKYERDNSDVTLRTIHRLPEEGRLHGPAWEYSHGRHLRRLKERQPRVGFDAATERNRKIVGDIVMAVHCPYWPGEAREWITRLQRPVGIISPDVIGQVVKYGCDFVFVKHKLSADYNECRFSFSRAELLIIRNWTTDQRVTYRTLHMLNKIIKSKNDASKLCSYYFKTLMLWATEEKSEEFWFEDVLYDSVRELIVYVLAWFNKKFCPNYFIRTNNMIDHLTDSNNQTRQLTDIDHQSTDTGHQSTDTDNQFTANGYDLTDTDSQLTDNGHQLTDTDNKSTGTDNQPTDTDLSADIEELWTLLQDAELITDLLHDCRLVEHKAQSTSSAVEMPIRLYASLAIYDHIHNDCADFAALFRNYFSHQMQDLLLREFSIVFRGLIFHRKAANSVTCDDGMYSSQALEHFQCLRISCKFPDSSICKAQSSETLEALIHEWFLYYMYVPEATESHSLINTVDDGFKFQTDSQRDMLQRNLLYDRLSDEAFVSSNQVVNHNQQVKNDNSFTRIAIYRTLLIDNDPYTNISFYKDWPGMSPTVNISWFINKAYLANLYYTTRCDYIATERTCDVIIDVTSNHSYVNHEFSHRGLPVIITTDFTDVYDEELQVILGFYSISSFTFNRIDRSGSVRLGVCPVLFALYLKCRCAAKERERDVLDDRLREYVEHLEKCDANKTVNNGAIVTATAYNIFIDRA